MRETVADFLLARLREWGISRIYGYPGDGINGILGALGRADNKPEFIQARHETNAAFMACGHAKFTGELGVCLATSGPGAIQLLNGLYDAKLDHQPVLAILGHPPRIALGGQQQQEIDLATLFKDVAHEFLQTCMIPEQLPALIDRAVRVALSERTVTALIFPADVQELRVIRRAPRGFKATPTTVGYTAPRLLPDEEELDRAADVLNAGRRVAILAGQGARGAAELVVETADVLGAGIAKALLGKDVLPDDLPMVTGSIGLLGTRPSYELMTGCDTLLIVGSNLPYPHFLPKPGKARGVQIDIDARLIGLRHPMEVQIVADARETLKRLLPKLKRKEPRKWRDKIERSVRDWWKLVESRAGDPAHPLNPQLVFWELSERLPKDALLTCDSGTAATWYAQYVRIRRGVRGSVSGTLASMGCAVPYAIAAKFAHPERPVIAMVGDGAMQMNGINELLTVAKYWRRWKDPRLIVLVLNNGDLNMVTWEMRAMMGDPKFQPSQDLPEMNYAKYADLIGLRGYRLDKPGDVGAVWDHALADDKPVVIDAVTDPSVPPLPPHVTFDEAKSLMSALLRGDPDAGDIVRHSFRAKIREFIR
jgi:pyruvate dehydrogenase (quinone)